MHSIRGGLAAKREIAAKTQRIVRTIEPPSRHTAIAPPSCRAVPVASPRHCRAVPVASLRHRPVALLHHRSGPQHETRHPEVPRAICYVRSVS